MSTHHLPVARALLAAVVLGGCASEPAQAPPASITVETHGALRDFMHGGAATTVVQLERLAADAGRVGVGALSELRGEVTMIDGAMLVAYPDGEAGSRTLALPPEGEGAALFVTARVPEWQALTLDHDVAWEELDGTIEALARNAGIDVTEAFPFIVEGATRELEWHVIDGSRIPPDAVGHAAHREAAITHRMADGSATLVGFYSDRHQGVFTHMDTRTHIHARVAEPLSSGHVDRVTLRAGSTLRLPASSNR